MSHFYTKEELSEFFFEAVDMFNENLDTDFDKDTIIIDFFNLQNGIAVYENFCKEHFPKYLTEPYKTEGYFEEIAAQAFVSDNQYGVLIRENIDFPLGEILQMFLHEISHLYCTIHEILGGNFFDKHCMGYGPEDGMMNAGYAIWREAVADIMADSMISEDVTVTLEMVKEYILEYYAMLTFDNPSAKKAMSLIIAYVMISAEVATIDDWEQAESRIKACIDFDNLLIYQILKMVFYKLHQSPYWEITPEFISTLGEVYIDLLAGKALRDRFKK